MDDGSGLEEGEACYYKNNDDYIDPDTTLSYIDEKIQRVLGHFQKDFEGGVSAENLGSKFGGYGSFLPSYERSHSIWSHKINRQRDCNAARSPNNLPSEGSLQNPKAPPPGSPAAINCHTISSHNTRETSGNISGGIDSCLLSTEVTDNYPPKDETLSSSGNLMNRSLKLRIKVGTDGTAQKNAAIYSGLGLDDSPMSSSENSTDVSEMMLPIFQGPVDGSPTKIIQVMTSSPVPGGALISPLHDRLLCLSRKEKRFGEIKHVLSLEDREQFFPKLVYDTTSLQNKGKREEKKKEVWLRERRINLKNKVYTCLDKEKSIFINRKSKTEAFEGKDILPSELKCKPVSNLVHDIGDLKPSCSASDVSLHSKEDRVNGRSKESYLESISGQDFLKSNKQETRDEKALKQNAENFGNYVLVNLRDNRKYKGDKTASSLEDPSKVSKCNDYLDPQSKKLFPKATSYAKGKDKLLSKTEQPGITGKNKLKGLQNKNIGGRASGSFEDGFKIGREALEDRKDTSCDTPECESERHRLKLHNNNMVREKNMDFFNSTGLDQNCNGMDKIKRASGDLQKVKDLGDGGMEKIKFGNKTKERLNGGKVDMHLMTGTSVNDGACPIVIDNDPASKVEPAVVAPVVIEENWVCCDSCQKWRLLPFGTKPEHLPEKWLCSMLNWLPGMNRCDISEQETTEKLNALCQLPFSEIVHALQNHANGPTSDDTKVDNHQLNQNLGLDTISNQGKKKDSLKEIKISGGSFGQSSLKTPQRESRKSRSLNGLSHPPSNQLKGSLGSVSELHNLIEGKSKPNLKEKFIDRGKCKQLKRKNKGPEENGLCLGAAKKCKTEDMCSFDNDQDFDVNLGKLGCGSNSGLSDMEGREQMLKYDEIGLSNYDKCNTKDKTQVSLKIRGKQAQISCGDRSFDNLVCGKNDSCTKKRKLKGWQDDDQNCHSSTLHGRMHVKEEICERLKKEKKSHLSKTKGQGSNGSDGDYNPKIEGRTTLISMSGIGNDFINGTEEIRNSCKVKELQVKNKKTFSEQTSVGKKLLSRNLGSRQGSIAANSSSSKVSLPHSTKASFGVKGSPAESVSSSPLRTFSLDKFGGEKEEITSFIHSESHKIYPVFGDRDIALNSSRKNKNSHEVQCRFLTADVNTVKQLGMCNNDSVDGTETRCKNKLKKVSPNEAFFPENKDLVLISNEKDKSVLSDMDLDKAKASDGFSELSKKSMIYEPEVDSYHVAPCSDGMGDVKQSIPRKCSTKLTRKENIHAIGDGLQIPQNLEDHCAADERLGALFQSDRTVRLQNKRSQDFEAENEGGLKTVEMMDGESKCFLSFGDECKQETLPFGGEPLQGSQRADYFHQLSVDTPKSNGLSESKTIKNLGNAGNKIGVKHGLQTPDQQGFRDLNASSLDRMQSSSQTACNTLKEAKDLRDYADRLKSSGFGFESNEAYFQSALKFLHGAFLLETPNNVSGKHGDKTQMQFYGITAELCEICAHEYERRREMAAAALAYKCIEVAYMRVVFHKHSNTNGDQHEMYSSLRTVVQGESPSSSVSDVDNLSNQATIDKAVFNKGGGSCVSGRRIFNAGNRMNFAQLLDFAHDINLAMEASKKSQNAFVAASVCVREAQNGDCVASIKKVIDFSFQDVEELVRLVRLAMEAITCSGFGSARD